MRPARGVWLYAYSGVPEGFSPRRASVRWYRYHFPGILRQNRLQEGAELLLSVGDLRAFQRGASRSPPRITSIELSRHGERIALDIRATHFVRNMVRRMAAGLQLFADGTLSRLELERALRGEGRRLAPAPPEHLVLMDVDYGFAFLPFQGARLQNDVGGARWCLAIEASLLSQLHDRLGTWVPRPTTL